MDRGSSNRRTTSRARLSPRHELITIVKRALVKPIDADQLERTLAGEVESAVYPSGVITR